MTRQLARRRRRDRLAGLALALLGVAVLVVAVIALQHPSTTSVGASRPRSVAGTPTIEPVTTQAGSSSTLSASASPSTSVAGSVAPSSTARLPLVVLNNTAVRGLAERASARFTAGGWTVTSYGNYQNDILSTCAYYDPSVSGAQASAQALQAEFPTIKRVVAKFAQLPAGPIVVVLTSDYSSN